MVDRYGVMGYPISHSRSPVIHRLFALQTGQDMQYELLQVAPDKLEQAIRQFQRTGGKGLNVTVPHKAAVARLVDHLSERASTAGAVNTIDFRGSEMYGDNTDGIGLLRDLDVNLGVESDAQRWVGESEAFADLGRPMLSVSGAGRDFHCPEDTPDRATSPAALGAVAAALGDAVELLLEAVG